MLGKVKFALTHPLLTTRFIQREVLRRWRKKTSSAQHQPKPRMGAILSTGFFEQADFTAHQDVTAAQRILKGELCLYGLRTFSVHKTLDWHTDYLSAYQWPKNEFSQDITYAYPTGTDIKNPWEVSRAHHLTTVGCAYRATGEEAYAKYVVDCITSWIKENPFYYGVNWKVAMEVGIRAANWLLAYDLIAESAAVTPEFTSLLLGSLAEHGQYIMENLEYFGPRSNHYMSDLIGLVWIGTLCPSLPHARRWQRFGFRELETEILHQFYTDGMDFESSVAYHRLVVELVGYTTLLLNHHQLPLSVTGNQRLEQAFQATAALLKANGQGPQFGDNDTGRLFIFSQYHHWQALDFAYLLDLGSLLGYAISPAHSLELNWLAPLEDVSINASAMMFPEGGLMVSKSGDWQLHLAFARLGQDGNGGHNHDDAGSFELSFGKTNIVVDPGTGCYTSNPEKRNYFRSALVHNAPLIKKLVHQPPKLLFVGDTFTSGKLIETSDTQWKLQLTAEHYICERSLELSPEGLHVHDTVEETNQIVQTTLTFPPELTVKKVGDDFQLGKELVLKTTNNTTLVEREYSPAYATIVSTHAIVIEATGSLSFTITKR